MSSNMSYPQEITCIYIIIYSYINTLYYITYYNYNYSIVIPAKSMLETPKKNSELVCTFIDLPLTRDAIVANQDHCILFPYLSVVFL